MHRITCEHIVNLVMRCAGDDRRGNATRTQGSKGGNAAPWWQAGKSGRQQELCGNESQEALLDEVIIPANTPVFLSVSSWAPLGERLKQGIPGPVPVDTELKLFVVIQGCPECGT